MTVKSLRIVVLLLLVMLLPLRGVSAAVVPCEQLAASHTPTMVVSHDHHGHGAESHEDASADHDHGGFDRLRHCLSSCSAMPLMSALPAVASPAMVGLTLFPRFAAPAPTFQSGGQDRPPRSP